MPLDALQRSETKSSRDGPLFVNPVYRDLLTANGLLSADDFVNLEGAIVSGHPDRHVMHVELGGVSCYLKREHQVPLSDRIQNYLAGCGFVSVSVREAHTLKALTRKGVAAPEWIAAGESSDGRAFLLIRDAATSGDLRAMLSKTPRLNRHRRFNLARQLARRIADVHNSGFTYPDLYSKHVLANGDGGEFTFLDWQRSRWRPTVTWHERCRDLAGLNASLADELANENLRLAFFIAYWRAASNNSMPFRRACRLINARTERLLRRSSVREQRLSKIRESQPLFWLDGEAFCVTKSGRELLDVEEFKRLAYPKGRPSTNLKLKRQLSIAGNVAELTTRRLVRRFSHAKDWLSGKRPNAPECRIAAHHLRQERLGEPRRLLAFGQRRVGWGVIDSFILTLVDSATEGGYDDQRRFADLLADHAKLAGN